ncbi:DUF3035 domain-containing protein [Sphingomonas sp. 1P08PE]|uniref:DUF3035 domain-containing protein n=1 Tax=Sphingomonas sp. 1P08PE TaxID=554122 RepID=UPI0039A32874
MRNVVIPAAGLALLSGCASGSALDRNRPDEFAVARQAPLVIPPDYALVPPQPGAARPQDSVGQQQTLDAIFGPAPRSAAENATLDQAGSGAADPGIRSSVGDPGTNVVNKGTTTRDIVAAPAGDGQDARASAGGAAPAPAPTPTPTPQN